MKNFSNKYEMCTFRQEKQVIHMWKIPYQKIYGNDLLIQPVLYEEICAEKTNMKNDQSVFFKSDLHKRLKKLLKLKQKIAYCFLVIIHRYIFSEIQFM